jgi:sulfotransferase family protein
MLSRFYKRLVGTPEVNTTLHITHAKAGSTWVDALLRQLFPRRVAERGRLAAADTDGNLDKYSFERGRIYPAMFMTRDQFLAHAELKDADYFVVIRDLRDTLISLYFSLKISHSVMDEHQREAREILTKLSEEEGLLWLVEQRGRRIAAIQTSWVNSDSLVLRYEDLLGSAQEIFEDVLIRKFQLPVVPAELASALKQVGFEKVFGRKLGDEDVTSHGRRGLPADWKNRFTPKLRERFAERYGDVLIKTGYEADTRWVS